jgi:hypothetical protein
MSSSAVARELNVPFSTISRLQCCFRMFGSTSYCPHNHRPHVWHHVGERFADVNRVPRCCGRVMVWAGIRTTKTIAFYWWQSYRDEGLRPIVVQFNRGHHLMFQHDNARPHVARICTQFLEAVNVPVLPWPAYSPDMSPIEHVWDALDWHIRQIIPVHANIQQQSGTTFHRPQSTALSTLCKGDVLRCMRQMAVTPDTDCFSDPSPYLFLR